MSLADELKDTDSTDTESDASSVVGKRVLDVSTPQQAVVTKSTALVVPSTTPQSRGGTHDTATKRLRRSVPPSVTPQDTRPTGVLAIAYDGQSPGDVKTPVYCSLSEWIKNPAYSDYLGDASASLDLSMAAIELADRGEYQSAMTLVQIRGVATRRLKVAHPEQFESVIRTMCTLVYLSKMIKTSDMTYGSELITTLSVLKWIVPDESNIDEVVSTNARTCVLRLVRADHGLTISNDDDTFVVQLRDAVTHAYNTHSARLLRTLLSDFSSTNEYKKVFSDVADPDGDANIGAHPVTNSLPVLVSSLVADSKLYSTYSIQIQSIVTDFVNSNYVDLTNRKYKGLDVETIDAVASVSGVLTKEVAYAMKECNNALLSTRAVVYRDHDDDGLSVSMNDVSDPRLTKIVKLMLKSVTALVNEGVIGPDWLDDVLTQKSLKTISSIIHKYAYRPINGVAGTTQYSDLQGERENDYKAIAVLQAERALESADHIIGYLNAISTSTTTPMYDICYSAIPKMIKLLMKCGALEQRDSFKALFYASGKVQVADEQFYIPSPSGLDHAIRESEYRTRDEHQRRSRSRSPRAGSTTRGGGSRSLSRGHRRRDRHDRSPIESGVGAPAQRIEDDSPVPATTSAITPVSNTLSTSQSPAPAQIAPVGPAAPTHTVSRYDGISDQCFALARAFTAETYAPDTIARLSTFASNPVNIQQMAVLVEMLNHMNVKVLDVMKAVMWYSKNPIALRIVDNVIGQLNLYEQEPPTSDSSFKLDAPAGNTQATGALHIGLTDYSKKLRLASAVMSAMATATGLDSLRMVSSMCYLMSTATTAPNSANSTLPLLLSAIVYPSEPGVPPDVTRISQDTKRTTPEAFMKIDEGDDGTDTDADDPTSATSTRQGHEMYTVVPARRSGRKRQGDTVDDDDLKHASRSALFIQENIQRLRRIMKLHDNSLGTGIAIDALSSTISKAVDILGTYFETNETKTTVLALDSFMTDIFSPLADIVRNGRGSLLSIIRRPLNDAQVRAIEDATDVAQGGTPYVIRLSTPDLNATNVTVIRRLIQSILTKDPHLSGGAVYIHAFENLISHASQRVIGRISTEKNVVTLINKALETIGVEACIDQMTADGGGHLIELVRFMGDHRSVPGAVDALRDMITSCQAQSLTEKTEVELYDGRQTVRPTWAQTISRLVHMLNHRGMTMNDLLTLAAFDAPRHITPYSLICTMVHRANGTLGAHVGVIESTLTGQYMNAGIEISRDSTIPVGTKTWPVKQTGEFLLTAVRQVKQLPRAAPAPLIADAETKHTVQTLEYFSSDEKMTWGRARTLFTIGLQLETLNDLIDGHVDAVETLLRNGFISTDVKTASTRLDAAVLVARQCMLQVSDMADLRAQLNRDVDSYAKATDIDKLRAWYTTRVKTSTGVDDVKQLRGAQVDNTLSFSGMGSDIIENVITARSTFRYLLRFFTSAAFALDLTELDDFKRDGGTFVDVLVPCIRKLEDSLMPRFNDAKIYSIGGGNSTINKAEIPTLIDAFVRIAARAHRDTQHAFTAIRTGLARLGRLASAIDTTVSAPTDNNLKSLGDYIQAITRALSPTVRSKLNETDYDRVIILPPKSERYLGYSTESLKQETNDSAELKSIKNRILVLLLAHLNIHGKLLSLTDCDFTTIKSAQQSYYMLLSEFNDTRFDQVSILTRQHRDDDNVVFIPEETNPGPPRRRYPGWSGVSYEDRLKGVEACGLMYLEDSEIKGHEVEYQLLVAVSTYLRRMYGSNVTDDVISALGISKIAQTLIVSGLLDTFPYYVMQSMRVTYTVAHSATNLSTLPTFDELKKLVALKLTDWSVGTYDAKLDTTILVPIPSGDIDDEQEAGILQASVAGLESNMRNRTSAVPSTPADDAHGQGDGPFVSIEGDSKDIIARLRKINEQLTQRLEDITKANTTQKQDPSSGSNTTTGSGSSEPTVTHALSASVYTSEAASNPPDQSDTIHRGSPDDHHAHPPAPSHAGPLPINSAFDGLQSHAALFGGRRRNSDGPTTRHTNTPVPVESGLDELYSQVVSIEQNQRDSNQHESMDTHDPYIGTSAGGNSSASLSTATDQASMAQRQQQLQTQARQVNTTYSQQLRESYTRAYQAATRVQQWLREKSQQAGLQISIMDASVRTAQANAASQQTHLKQLEARQTAAQQSLLSLDAEVKAKQRILNDLKSNEHSLSGACIGDYFELNAGDVQMTFAISPSVRKQLEAANVSLFIETSELGQYMYNAGFEESSLIRQYMDASILQKKDSYTPAVFLNTASIQNVMNKDTGASQHALFKTRSVTPIINTATRYPFQPPYCVVLVEVGADGSIPTGVLTSLRSRLMNTMFRASNVDYPIECSIIIGVACYSVVDLHATLQGASSGRRIAPHALAVEQIRALHAEMNAANGSIFITLAPCLRDGVVHRVNMATTDLFYVLEYARMIRSLVGCPHYGNASGVSLARLKAIVDRVYAIAKGDDSLNIRSMGPYGYPSAPVSKPFATALNVEGAKTVIQLESVSS